MVHALPFLSLAHQRLRARMQLPGPQVCSGRKTVKSSARSKLGAPSSPHIQGWGQAASRQTMQGKAAGAARVGGRGPALRLHQAIVNIKSMLTQAFQCFAKEADGARSPFFVHRPPKVKSSNAAPRSASMQRPKDGGELRKVEARSTIVAAYSRMGPSCKETNRFCRDGPAGAWTTATKVINHGVCHYPAERVSPASKNAKDAAVERTVARVSADKVAKTLSAPTSCR